MTEPIYLDGGGDPDLAQIDAFLLAHFNARAVNVERLASVLHLTRHEWPRLWSVTAGCGCTEYAERLLSLLDEVVEKVRDG